MATNISPYLYFEGNCEEALRFYEGALGGKLVHLMRASEGPKEFQQGGDANSVMHATMQVGDTMLMASDSMGQPATNGSNTVLSLNFDTAESIESTFTKMKEGGKVTMDLHDTFWGARFGTLTDKYGINWMFNYDKK